MKKNLHMRACQLSMLFALLFAAQTGWSQLPPISCTGTNQATAIISEDFSGGIGIFTQLTTDDADFQFDTNNTASTATGPSGGVNPADLTMNEVGNQYIYRETSGGSAGDIAIVQTSVDLTDPTLSGPVSLSVFYHAYGATTGTLEVRVSRDGGATFTTEFTSTGQVQTDELDPYNQILVDLTADLGSTVLVQLTATRGTSFTGDIAFDLFQVYACAQGCTLTPPAAITVSAEASQCGAQVTVPNPVVGAACVSFQSTALLTEDFNSCAQPAGWTLTFIPDASNTTAATVGPCNTANYFQFDCTMGTQTPGAPAIPTGFSGCQFVIDDDGAGAGLDGEGYLESPVIDMTGFPMAEIMFDYQHNALSSDAVVQYFNGTAWVDAFRQSNVDNSATGVMVTVPAGNANFQVRVGHDDTGGSFAWGTAYDNIVVSGVQQVAATATNDFNGTTNASGFFPVGTTTITFTVFDNFGNPVTATTDVTVVDDQAPVFTSCPGDITLNLGDGDCDVLVDFVVEAVDNCDGAVGGSGSLTTTFADNNAFDGNMFDVTNQSGGAIQFDSYEVNIDGGTATIEVYQTTTANTYVGNETDASAWTLIGSATVTSNGAGNPTPVVIPGYTLAAGETRGIYVTTTGAPDMNYTNGANTYNDGTLMIQTGVGKQYPFAATFNPRTWNGTITYSAAVAPTTVVQTTGLPSGSLFAPGTTLQTFVATDANGNVSTCTFNVIVNPFTNGSSTVTVNPVVQASLSPTAGCSFVTSDMILEGGPYGCLDSFLITRTPAVAPGFGCPTGPIYQGAVPITCADIGRPVRVVITDPMSGNSQWASIIVEDKIAPTLVGCEAITVGCNGTFQPTFTASPGSLISSTVPTTTATISVPAITAGNPITDLNVSLDISHTWIGDLTIELTSPQGTTILLYDQNCTTQDDILTTFDDEAAFCIGTSPTGCLDFSQGLSTQTLNCAGFAGFDLLSIFDGEDASGDWLLEVTDNVGGDNGTLNSVSLAFQFANAISVANSVTATDNCPGTTIQFSERNIPGSCAADRQVIRTFIATDASGNSSTCSQTITFELPDLADVTLPANLDGIDGPMLDCTSGYPTIGSRVTLSSSTTITVGAGPGTIVNGGDIQIPVVLTGLPADAQIEDLNISLDIDYSTIGDLRIQYGRQFNPNPITILDGACGTRDDILATFDDEGFATFDCATFDPTLKGTFRPAQPLSSFDGQSPNGTFILYVRDQNGTNFDFGQVEEITVTYLYSTATAITAPTINGSAFNPLDCQINVTFDDTVIDVCATSYKVRRQFTIINMCTGDDLVFNQIIAVMDQNGPIIECPRSEADNPIDLIAISAQTNQNPQSGYGPCLGSIVVPGIQILSDDCSGIASVTTELYELDQVTQMAGTQVGSVNTNGGLFSNVGLDDGNFVSALDEPSFPYVVRYVVEDSCANESVSEVFYNVIERVAPVADCDEITSLNLTTTDTTFVDAGVFDDGSYDVCSDIFFYARRMTPTAFTQDLVAFGNFFESQRFKNFVPQKFRERVAFTCDDDQVTVYFLVVDAFVQGYIEFTTDVTIPSLPPATRNNPNTPFTILPDGTFFLSTFPGIGGPTKDIWDGHYNICMVTVNVSDKVAPIKVLNAPNRTILCTDNALRQQYADNTQLDFDAPLFNDPCGFTVSLTVLDGTGNCGDGVIRRRFQATDNNGNTSVLCEQRITVLLEHDYTILFPNDVENLNCGNGVNLADTLTDDDISEDGCDLLAISYTDQRFTADDDACYKILRTYDIINWCEWDGVSDAVRITNPTFTNAGPRLDVVVNAQGIDDVRINFTPTSIQSVGRFEYVQSIKVYDDIDPVVTVGTPAPCNPLSVVDDVAGLGCGSGVSVPFSVTDNCADDFDVTYFVVTGVDDANGDGIITTAELSTGLSYDGLGDGDPFGTLTNVGGTFTVNGTFPLGTNVLVVTVDDRCANLVEVRIPFDAEDCKPPTPKALNGVAIDLMITGMVRCGVSRIDNGSFDGCGDVTLLIKRSSAPRSAADTSILLTCADLGSVLVDLIAIDEFGNEDFVQTYILVQDNLGACSSPASPRISASLTTDGGNGVGGATVNLSGDASMTQTTTASGAAGFDVTAGGDYTVSALLNADPANGVTTYDLYLIGQHILGVTPLSTFSQLTAADANNSASISAYDMTVIRRVILGLDANFQNNTSWRFFDANNTASEVVSFNDVQAAVAADFLAVKVGDVNGTAQANSRQALAPRTVRGEFALEAADAVLAAGETATVAFSASDATALGYQLTIEWDADALEVVAVNGAAHSEAGFGTHLLAEGKLTLSHDGEMAGELFSLEVRALRDGVALSEVLVAGSSVTAAEAYGLDGDRSVALRFSGADAAAGYALEQNRPNPFAGTTRIAFTLAEAGQAALTVTDIAGRVVWRTTGKFAQGRTEVEIAASELPAAGVLSYTLTAGDFTATRKMVVIE